MDKSTIEAKIITMLVEFMGKNNITKNSTFEELGMDNLDSLEFIMKVGNEFCIKFNSSELATLRSVDMIVAEVYDNLQ